VPKLWTETIEEHRRAVHDATLDTTAALAREHGLASVTMSQIAAAAGIGRATLYKYFPDVEAILVAWHDRQITLHLRQLTAARDAAGTPAGQLEAVLTAFALIQHEHHGTELPVALLHRGEHVARARHQLQDLVAGSSPSPCPGCARRRPGRCQAKCGITSVARSSADCSASSLVMSPKHVSSAM